MIPELEDPALRLQGVQMSGSIVRHAGVEHVVVSPGNHRDRIDLHVAELLDGAVGRVLAAAESGLPHEALCIQRDAAQLVGRDPGR